MTVQPLSLPGTMPDDRYLAAYATVHSMVEAGETVLRPARPAERQPAHVAPPAAIPAARLARSTGGRRKAKRRRFRVPGSPAAD